MDKIFKGLRKVLYWISVGSMSVMLAIIFFQVISRYLFNYTFEWSEELARFLFVWVVFLGSALIMGESGHMAVQLLPSRLAGSRAGTYLEVFINLCSYAFILLLLIQGSKMSSVMMFQTAPALGVPMGYVYSIIPLSGCLMLLYLFKDTIRIISTFKRGRG